MADGGGRLCCSGVREERQGVFIGQQCSKAVSPELRWPQWRRHGAEAVGDGGGLTANGGRRCARRRVRGGRVP
jgi:hypothetical protein